MLRCAFYPLTALVWLLLLLLPAFAQPTTQSDDELRQKIIGEWFAQDRKGSTVYTFNEDGTWSESGVYYFKEGPREVFLSGEWYVSNGFLYHSVVECSVPAKIKPGKYDKIRIKHVTDNEFFLRLKPSKFHPHLKIQ